MSLVIQKCNLNQLIPDHHSLPVFLFDNQYDYGQMPPTELMAICKIVKKKQPKIIFEIGTYRGGTTLRLAANSEAEVYTLDLPPKKHKDYVVPQILDPELDVYPDEPGIIFQNTSYEKRIHQLYGNTLNYDYSPFFEKVDLVFVDASHHYNYVLNDSLNAFKILKYDGVIIWHDYASYAPEVMKALDEIAKTFPLFHINGTSLVVFYGKQINHFYNISNTETFLLKIKGLQNLGKTEDAYETVKLALKHLPGSLELLNLKAEIEVQRGNTNKGQQILLDIIKIKPDYVDALNNLGVLEYYEGNLNAAKEFFKNALILDANNKTAIFYLSKIKNNSINKSVACIQKIDIHQLIHKYEAISVQLFRDIIDQEIMPLKDLIPICKIVQNKKPKVIFEFGTYQGSTTVHFAANSKAIIYTLDLPPKGHENFFKPKKIDKELDVYPEKPGIIFHNTQYEVNINQIYGDSKYYNFSKFYNKADIVFVDACHHFENVLKYSLNALKIVRTDGIIIWHNFASYAPGVVKALGEISTKFPLFHINKTNLVVFYGNRQPYNIYKRFEMPSSDLLKTDASVIIRNNNDQKKTILSYNDKVKSLRKLYLYVGHHKCATTWINRIIKSVCSSLHLNFFNAHNKNMLNNLDIDKVDFFSDTGICIMQLEIINQLNYRGFHVIRDPRDIIVSAYFSHLKTHSMGEWLREHRKKLNSVNQEEGIMLEIDFRSAPIINMLNWNYNNPNIYETRFELITTDPLNEFIKIFQFLDLYPQQLHPNTLNHIISTNSFNRMSKGRKIGQEDTFSHYRKGIHGDWVNYFTDKNKKYFKEKLGHVLIHLGYEKDYDW